MPHISNLTEIVAAADIVAIAQRFLPGLVREGGCWATQCPIHNGKGRSLKIDPRRGTFRCWSQCQAKGDALGLVAFLKRLDLRNGDELQEAAEILAEEVGIAVVYETRPGHAPTGPTRADLFAAIAAAHAHYQANLSSNQEALDYLAARGFTRELCRQWEFGYAKGLSVQAALSLPEETLLKAGILCRAEDTKRLYDPLSARITIPLRNPAGRIVGWTARLLEPTGSAGIPSGTSPEASLTGRAGNPAGTSPEASPSRAGDDPSPDSSTTAPSNPQSEIAKSEISKGRPKYKNTPETTLFHKGELLFGYDQAARMQGPILVLEGQFKVIACHHAGLRAVAPGGTAFTPTHAALLQRLNPPAIWLAADRDPAGAKATLAMAATLRRLDLPLQIGILETPVGFDFATKLDPDDLLAKHQPIRYHARDFLPWACDHFLGGLDGPARAAAVSRDLLPLVNQREDHLVRLAELSQLADLTGIPLSILGRALPPLPDPDPEPIPVSPQLTPGRLLVSAILQAPPSIDEHPDDPTWYLDWIDWAHLPLDLLGWLQQAHRIREIATRCDLLLGPAIHRFAGRYADQFDLWSAVTHPCPITPDYLLDLQTTIPHEVKP